MKKTIITILLLTLNKALDTSGLNLFTLFVTIPIFICGLSAVLILSSYNVIKEAYNTNDVLTAQKLNSKSQKLDYYGWQCFISGTIFTFAFLLIGVIINYMDKLMLNI